MDQFAQIAANGIGGRMDFLEELCQRSSIKSFVN